ncbi:glycolate oxidase subunit GlcF [Tepidimonas taiwanensis]|uniref:Glycolate oxidase iron-sulfur subunit n=1 Tax=Tepidimonas taiwanensis TaxID=307486 RepID=A0A554X4Q4_9BURK|nr:glycolate oxidase subunit GlcF [Tepidimonas taiwanensis]MDM7463385.1 glycolate oxidase subunit GlcF [Tepidimonas taiwanensis]TSE30821.1 Lactate utilization protein A [Tepidimonas taiwanensis]UBQ05096.1 glycolate oxidase subunit GlcF [Tepidimonas taiwanensis]
MQTQLAAEFAGTPDGQEADAILRRCVHCGFCTATCPTYQLLGDELDGPRGRIYLIKQVLEGAQPTRATQRHLDRCLTCRNCETTCPSGVDYGHLLDIGRKVVAQHVPRPAPERAVRWLLREGLTSPLFAPAMRLGQAVRPLLPAALRAKVPERRDAGAWPQTPRARRVLLLAGCVQPAMLPTVNAATARVLDAAGIQTIVAPEAGCCGAIRHHLDDIVGALAEMRANIDAWWPWIAPADGSAGVEAIVMNASGCGAMVKDYGHALRHDPAYAEKARRVSELAKDLSELLPELVPAWRERLRDGLPAGVPRRLVFHPPCTLQHGQRLRGLVERHLGELGFSVTLAAQESHLCCGSAGTYSVLQPGLATQLRDRKLTHLQAVQPDVIVSANIGCITHLQSGTATPVRHWVEVVDAALIALP